MLSSFWIWCVVYCQVHLRCLFCNTFSNNKVLFCFSFYFYILCFCILMMGIVGTIYRTVRNNNRIRGTDIFNYLYLFTYLLHFSIISTDILTIISMFLYYCDTLIIVINNINNNSLPCWRFTKFKKCCHRISDWRASSMHQSSFMPICCRTSAWYARCSPSV